MPAHPLAPVCKHWLDKVQIALNFKRREFQNDADEGMKFFDGPYDFMYGIRSNTQGAFVFNGNPDHFPRPSFGMTVNKVAEMVQLFGPALYHKNPVRMVNPRKVPDVPIDLFGGLVDPMMAAQYQALQIQVQTSRATDQARAELLQHYLDYTPEALDLKTESRWAIDEAIIKGMGLLWTEVYTPPSAGTRMIGSFFGSVDELIMDSDANLRREAKWIARRCVHPVWQVEEEYGYPVGSLKGQVESHHQQAGISAIPELEWRRQQGTTNDLLVYWKIYSKMGMGGQLAGAPPGLRESLAPFGDWCYLVVAPGIDFPINLPLEVMASGDMQAILARTQWPTPFWADDGWPFAEIVFHDRPNRLWPMSHLKPGMGELKFINWVYSFLAGKIKTACRDFLVMKKSLGEEVKNTILHGSDYELVELEEQHGTISEVVAFLQHPEFQGDIWKVLQAVEDNFEKRTGLTELMYGTSARQFRSAAESSAKREAIQVRPDDMASKVEEAMTLCARHEAFACRWHLHGQDVLPVMGQVGAQLWDNLITVSDPAEILYQLEYRIEAGSARKPNQAGRIDQMNQAMQNLFQPLWQYAMQMGDPGPVNALLGDWAKANDLDVTKYLIQPPPPPPPPGSPGVASSGGGSSNGKAPPGRNGASGPPPAQSPGFSPPASYQEIQP